MPADARALVSYASVRWIHRSVLSARPRLSAAWSAGIRQRTPHRLFHPAEIAIR